MCTPSYLEVFCLLLVKNHQHGLSIENMNIANAVLPLPSLAGIFTTCFVYIYRAMPILIISNVIVRDAPILPA